MLFFACSVIFHAFCRLLFFLNHLFGNILSGIPSEYQTVRIQIRPDALSDPIWALFADNASTQRVKRKANCIKFLKVGVIFEMRIALYSERRRDFRNANCIF